MHVIRRRRDTREDCSTTRIYYFKISSLREKAQPQENSTWLGFHVGVEDNPERYHQIPMLLTTTKANAKHTRLIAIIIDSQLVRRTFWFGITFTKTLAILVRAKTPKAYSFLKNAICMLMLMLSRINRFSF